MGGNGHTEHTLLIGIGNEYRDDDAMGILVAREIARRSPHEGLKVIEESGEGTSLMSAWEGFRHVLLVDAIASGNVPGLIHRLDAGHDGIPKKFFHYSSHAFGVAEAIAVARRLNTIPPSLIIYGIEGKEFGTGVGLSDPVLKSIPELIAMIEEELHAFHAG